jgi:hypothetical protein
VSAEQLRNGPHAERTADSTAELLPVPLPPLFDSEHVADTTPWMHVWSCPTVCEQDQSGELVQSLAFTGSELDEPALWAAAQDDDSMLDASMLHTCSR